MDVMASYRLMAVLDVARFGERTDPEQAALRENLYRITDVALSVAGIEPVGKDDRGDGIMLLLPGNTPKQRLLGLFVDALGNGLRAHAQRHGGTARELRVRLALHAGEVARDGRGWVGTDLNTAFRMVDLPALRGTLAAAARAVLAVAVSEVLYEAVVRHGYPGIDPAEYAAVDFSVKELRDRRLWLRVPGYHQPPGLPTAAGARPSGEEAAGTPPQEAPRIGIGTVHGGISEGGIGVSTGTVRQTFHRASAPPPPQPAELRAELERLRGELKESLRRREIDEETYQDAAQELTEAERLSEPEDSADRGRLLRALRRLRGLVEDAAGLATAVGALIRSLRGEG